MIEIQKLRKTYTLGGSQVKALDGVSLSIKAGEFVAIMGPSGSGKSTLLQVLGLLDVPDSGSYKLLGREVAGLGPDELATLRSQQLGFIFQQFNLLARTSAAENVALPSLYHPVHPEKNRAATLLKQVGLEGRMDHTPAQLSGGQQQRVAIARALMNGPRLLFADEPTGNLDSKSSHEILDILKGLNRKGITVVMVTHEADIAAQASRILVMRDGRVVSDRRKGAAPRESGKKVEQSALPPSRKESLKALLTYAKQAWRALTANLVRTALSVLGILIGVAAVIAIFALGDGAQKMMTEQFAAQGSNLLFVMPGAQNRGGVSLGQGSSSVAFDLEDARATATLPEVNRTTAEISGRGIQAVAEGKNWSTSVVGAEPQYVSIRPCEPSLGRFFTEEEMRSRARVAVIGVTVARQLFGEGSPLGKDMKLNRVSFKVIGVLLAKGSNGFEDQDDRILLPITTAMYRLLGRNHIGSITVEVKSPDQIDAAMESIKQLLRKRFKVALGKEDPFQIRNMADFQNFFKTQIENSTFMLKVVAAISLLVGGIGIMNIMLVTVTERTREIGLRKALGAKRNDILFQFLVESVVVSTLGGAAGVLAGALFAGIFALAMGWPTDPSLGSASLGIGFSTFVGLVFGIWPAFKAASLDPIQALRYE